MSRVVVFDPLLVWPLILAAAVLAVLVVGLAWWRGTRGWWLRGLAAIALLAALTNPSLQSEERDALSDIVIAVVDRSASQRIADRPEQIDAAVADLEAEIAARPNTELRLVEIGDGEDDSGTLLMSALAEALAQEPQGRIAGIVMITDGRTHDIARLPPCPRRPMCC